MKHSFVPLWTQYYIVGDSAYSLSKHMIKPFSTRELEAEENEDDRRKMAYFNKKLSGARTTMTKNVYGRI